VIAGGVAGLGRAGAEALIGFGRMAHFAGRIAASAFTPPLRARRLLNETYDAGVLSLAIVLASALAVGMVLGLQGYTTLVRFGAEDSLGAVVGLTLIRELGPVLTALLVAGRAGSAATAEIGSMVTTEQLDGLRMMSIDPVDYVVRPKATALLLVMPLLCSLFVVAALAGGYLVGVALLGLDGGRYLSSLEDSVRFGEDVLQSLVKALVFGAVVGLVATWRGYTAEPHAQGVSRATTSTVVTASVSILVCDYVITALWGV
jgi:phospholipid/cholesterol/gamma-HCH transport system permease protein